MWLRLRQTRVSRGKPKERFGLFDIIVMVVIGGLIMAFLDNGGASMLPFAFI